MGQAYCTVPACLVWQQSKSNVVDAEEDAIEQAKLKAAQSRPRREGITSARVDVERAKSYVKPVYPKDAKSLQYILNVLQTNSKVQVVCGHLQGDAMLDVANAFYELDFRRGEDIIRQGEAGDRMYIVRDGLVDVFVNRAGPDGKMPPGNGPKVVTLTQGSLFGELALMYTAPRAATVVAESAVVKTWALDQEPFKMMLLSQRESQLELYHGFLCEVSIFSRLNKFELSVLADALESQLYDEGETLIKQGETGEHFYIVEDGACEAYINGPEGEKLVYTYEKPGEYFGELALLKSQPREATVRAAPKGVSVLVLSKEDFTNLLGPIQDVLRREGERYPQYANVKNSKVAPA